MEELLKNIFDNLNVEETDEILEKIVDMPSPKAREELRSRILERSGVQEADKMEKFTNTKLKRRVKRKLINAGNIAACLMGVILLSSVSIYAFSGKSLFDFFLQKEGKGIVGSYVGYDSDTMIIDNYIMKVDNYLVDEEIGSGYCVLTVEGKGETDADLKKILKGDYFCFSFDSNSAIIEAGRTIRDGIVYIPMFFSQANNRMEDIKLLVTGGSDYVEDKGGVIEEEQVERIIYNKDDEIAEVNLGYLNFSHHAKKLKNKHETFQTNAKLTISSIGLMIENLDEGRISDGSMTAILEESRILDLSIGYINGEKEELIKNGRPLYNDLNWSWETNRNNDETDIGKEIYERDRILYGKAIKLDLMSKVYINGEEIDLN